MRHVAESRCHRPLSLEEKVSGGGEWRVMEGGGRGEVKGEGREIGKRGREGREGMMKGRVKGMDSHVISSIMTSHMTSHLISTTHPRWTHFSSGERPSCERGHTRTRPPDEERSSHVCHMR